MLKIQEIREIIKLIDQSSIEKFSYEADGAKIVLKKSNSQKGAVGAETVHTVEQRVALPEPANVEVTTAPQQAEVQAAPVAEQQEVDTSLHQITSPMVGTFYAAASPEAEAYAKVGDKVTPESIVCIVEAMKLFNEIEAEVSGEIVEILVKDGQLVEYGHPLFLVKAN